MTAQNQYPVSTEIKHHYPTINGPLSLRRSGQRSTGINDSWGCGHYVQQECTEEVNKLPIEFLDREIKNSIP